MRRFLQLITLLLALGLLCGCAPAKRAGEQQPPSGTDRPGESDSATQEGTKESTASQEEIPPQMRTVRVLERVDAVRNDVSYSCSVSYTTDGISLYTEVEGYGANRTVFDMQGRLALEQTYDDQGSLTRYSIYSYDENGNKISQYFYDPDGTMSQFVLYEYDDMGRMIRHESWNRNSLLTNATEYRYFENGKLAWEGYYGMDGNLVVEDIYAQDAQGQLTGAESIHYKYPDWSGTRALRYDSEGRLTENLWDDDSVSHDGTDYYYTYDELGRLVKSYSGFESSVLWDESYTYDAEGYLITREDKEDGIVCTLIYTEMELPEPLAEAAEKWSKDGAIDYFTKMPNPKL